MSNRKKNPAASQRARFQKAAAANAGTVSSKNPNRRPVESSARGRSRHSRTSIVDAVQSEIEWKAKVDEARRKRAKRRLDDLERSNYRDVPIDFALRTHEHTNLAGPSVIPSITSSAPLTAAQETPGPEERSRDITAESTSSSAPGTNRTASTSKTPAASFVDGIPVPPASAIVELPQRRRDKINATIKRIVGHRRGFNAAIDESSSHPLLLPPSPFSYLTAGAPATKRSLASAPRFCTVCGYWGDMACLRCEARVCGARCKATHQETRCERAF